MLYYERMMEDIVGLNRLYSFAWGFGVGVLVGGALTWWLL